MAHVTTTMATTTALALALLVAVTTLRVDAAAAASSPPQGVTLQLHRVAASSHSDVYRRRRLQKVVDGTFEAVPLNIGLGTHYAWVYAGTPPQRASVIADTGSSLMAFPCTGCDGCGTHTDEPFAVLNSSTLTHVTCASAAPVFKCKGCSAARDDMCAISQAYMEGSSWDATVVEDIVFLGDFDSVANTQMRNQFGTHYMFGCQRKETGLFITQVADGIMGLANNDNNIVAKLFAEQKIPQPLFALCFAEDGGSMAIGTPDLARHTSAIAYAPLASDSLHTDFYNVVVKDIRINNTTIHAPPTAFSRGHFIVDSGTTDSYLPTAMKSAFDAAFQAATGLMYAPSGSPQCTTASYTDAQIATFPTLQVVLAGEDGEEVVLDVQPEQYLILETHGYCGNVFLSEFSGGVIGANIMLNRDVIFDRAHKRIGFADADCTYRQLEAVDDDTEEKETPTVSPTPTPTREHSAAPGVVATNATPAPIATNVSANASIETNATATATPSVVTTQAPTPSSSTKAPTPSPSPTTQAPTPSPSPTTKAPTPTVTPSTDATIALSANDTTTATHTKHDNDDDDNVDEHPMVLTVVGTVLVVVFLFVVAASIKMNRGKAAKDHNWSRVKENEDGDEDDDEEEEEDGSEEEEEEEEETKHDDDSDDDDRSPRSRKLSTAASSSGGAKKKKKKATSPRKMQRPLSPKHARRSDDIGSDSNDDDDDDAIFERAAHDDTKHDTRMLERL